MATDEGDTRAALQTPADALAFALEKKLSRPANFYGVSASLLLAGLLFGRNFGRALSARTKSAAKPKP